MAKPTLQLHTDCTDCMYGYGQCFIYTHPPAGVCETETERLYVSN